MHAVLVIDPGIDPDVVIREANTRLEDHQKIRRGLVWPEPALPRTEGTGKLKRAALREWVRTGAPARPAAPSTDRVSALVAKYAGRGDLSPGTTINELGLSSLERVDLMVALEDAFGTHLDERAFAEIQAVGQLRELVEGAAARGSPPAEPMDFPVWNRSWPARAVGRIGLSVLVLPLARAFAWIRVEGREHLAAIDGPVIFASNHQSYMDTPVIMAALPPRWRYRLAPAMAKEFFEAHFFPAAHGRLAWLTNSLNYYLATLVFNAFPLPRHGAGARQTLRYMGELVEGGFSVLIFPEGHHTETARSPRSVLASA